MKGPEFFAKGTGPAPGLWGTVLIRIRTTPTSISGLMDTRTFDYHVQNKHDIIACMHVPREIVDQYVSSSYPLTKETT
jgi:hypothetical protein